MDRNTLVFEDVPIGEWLATVQVAGVKGAARPIGWMAVHRDGERSVIRLSDGSCSVTGFVSLPDHKELVDGIAEWVEACCPTIEEAMLRWAAPRMARNSILRGVV